MEHSVKNAKVSLSNAIHNFSDTWSYIIKIIMHNCFRKRGLKKVGDDNKDAEENFMESLKINSNFNDLEQETLKTITTL